MRRDVDYRWRLAELMARHGMHNSTDLAPRLRERGIELSPSQIYRIVTQRPERVSLLLMAALADIFECGPEDLVTFTAADAKPRKAAAAATAANVVAMTDAIKPVRARVIRDD